jgi:hypothetical protein
MAAAQFFSVFLRCEADQRLACDHLGDQFLATLAHWYRCSIKSQRRAHHAAQHRMSQQAHRGRSHKPMVIRCHAGEWLGVGVRLESAAVRRTRGWANARTLRPTDNRTYACIWPSRKFDN